MKINEKWVSVGKFKKRYEGYYEISDLGRIKSLDRIVERKSGHNLTVKSKILSINKRQKTGYNHSCIGLSWNGIVETVNVDELVLICFEIKKPSKKHKAYHIDNDHTNNKLSNLIWATNKEIEEIIYKKRGFEEWYDIKNINLPNIERYEINKNGDIRRKSYFHKAIFKHGQGFWTKYQILKKYKTKFHGIDIEYVLINIGNNRKGLRTKRMPICLLYYMTFKSND